ncbi:hypothetical protein DOY81_004319 [Sarcophaga bullata]|nr:hypothetical protein DOY81_004319 [Sarcophaga bullata]
MGQREEVQTASVKNYLLRGIKAGILRSNASRIISNVNKTLQFYIANMKFAIVVVLVALALGANASIIPGTVVVGHPGAVAVHAGVVPALSPVQIVSGPAVVAAPVVVPAPVGTYVAKTRGAVHVAPLVGHVQSAVSANLEPAPGTL